MHSYRPEELFDESGTPSACDPELAPQGERRMGMNPHANGGMLLRDLALPDFRDYAVAVARPGGTDGEATRVLGGFLRDVMKRPTATGISACSARTRPRPTGWTPCSRSPSARPWASCSPPTRMWGRTAG